MPGAERSSDIGNGLALRLYVAGTILTQRGRHVAGAFGALRDCQTATLPGAVRMVTFLSVAVIAGNILTQRGRHVAGALGATRDCQTATLPGAVRMVTFLSVAVLSGVLVALPLRCHTSWRGTECFCADRFAVGGAQPVQERALAAAFGVVALLANIFFGATSRHPARGCFWRRRSCLTTTFARRRSRFEAHLGEPLPRRLNKAHGSISVYRWFGLREAGGIRRPQSARDAVSVHLYVARRTKKRRMMKMS